MDVVGKDPGGVGQRQVRTCLTGCESESGRLFLCRVAATSMLRLCDAAGRLALRAGRSLLLLCLCCAAAAVLLLLPAVEVSVVVLPMSSAARPFSSCSVSLLLHFPCCCRCCCCCCCRRHRRRRRRRRRAAWHPLAPNVLPLLQRRRRARGAHGCMPRQSPRAACCRTCCALLSASVPISAAAFIEGLDPQPLVVRCRVATPPHWVARDATDLPPVQQQLHLELALLPSVWCCDS